MKNSQFCCFSDSRKGLSISNPTVSSNEIIYGSAAGVISLNLVSIFITIILIRKRKLEQTKSHTPIDIGKKLELKYKLAHTVRES